MRFRRLGRTNLEVSEIGFGAWGIGKAWWGETAWILKAGDSWVCEVGQSTVVESTGSEPAVMRMHWLIPPGQK